MWTPATRAQHTRVSKRYQTDLSDAEWALERFSTALSRHGIPVG